MTRDIDRPMDWDRDLVGKLQIFADRWANYGGTEQAGAQDFLRVLLEIYDVGYKPGTLFEQHPVRVKVRKRNAGQGDLFGAEDAFEYTTERMDMYLPKVCVWEIKAPSEKNLAKHHEQILGYWARMRTRYMVLCNFDEFWIYDTNEEMGHLEPQLRFSLSELPARGDALLFLRGEQPDLSARSERVTAQVASMLGRLVRELVQASTQPAEDRHRITKFLLECVFAMFAEDTDLIPPLMFTNAMQEAVLTGSLSPVFLLFDDFAARRPEDRSNRFAPYVNGELFDKNHPRLALSDAQIHDLYCAAKDFQWRDVRPEIFGSIFEQALDVVTRHELGAHYTREADIARVVGPTIVAPWQERIAAIRRPQDAERVVEEMRSFHILDPACGCGNFLYVAYREMKRLEAALAHKWHQIHRVFAKRRADVRPAPPRPYFTLEQIHGIEIDGFAAFLARVVLWIGEHLAKLELGLDEETLPLKNLEGNIRHADALLTDWPRPEGELAIVGNPPYLGVRKMRRELGDAYVEELFGRFPANRAADYVTYWFPKALEVLRPGERAGYVCTNSVAQNESREASLDRVITQGGTFTEAWRSYPWPGEAAVHIAIVNWVMGPWEGLKRLDDREVSQIPPGLVEGADVSTARRLAANAGLCFMGCTVGNEGFVLSAAQREALVAADPGSEAVIKPYLIGRDVNREPDQRPTRWVIDFGTMTKEEAERYLGAFRHVQREVYPQRRENRREAYARYWWRFVEARRGMRAAIASLPNVLVLPRVSPHLVVSRQPSGLCFDGQLMVVALPDPYHFGVLQSRLHALWARARGSTLKGDLRYTNTTIFESFPFPPLLDGTYDPRLRREGVAASRVAAAAEDFERLRGATCRERELGLTKVHNELEEGAATPLRAAYDALNDAVAACYGFPEGVWRDDKESLRLLLNLNHRLAADATLVEKSG